MKQDARRVIQARTYGEEYPVDSLFSCGLRILVRLLIFNLRMQKIVTPLRRNAGKTMADLSLPLGHQMIIR
jgi:hypothetical protein